jgi:hypothetical protein
MLVHVLGVVPVPYSRVQLDRLPIATVPVTGTAVLPLAYTLETVCVGVGAVIETWSVLSR